MEIIIFIGTFLIAFAIISHIRSKQQNDWIKTDRLNKALEFNSPSVRSDISSGGKAKSQSTMIGSIITGVPVQTRNGDGSLTGAGAQQLYWCDQMLKDIGKKKYLTVNVMSRKQRYTYKQIEQHKASI